MGETSDYKKELLKQLEDAETERYIQKERKVKEILLFLKGDFFEFFYLRYSTLLHLPPSDSTMSKDAGIEPRTVATLALQPDAVNIRLDLTILLLVVQKHFS